jgi:hypothetical protein
VLEVSPGFPMGMQPGVIARKDYVYDADGFLQSIEKATGFEGNWSPPLSENFFYNDAGDLVRKEALNDSNFGSVSESIPATYFAKDGSPVSRLQVTNDWDSYSRQIGIDYIYNRDGYVVSAVWTTESKTQETYRPGDPDEYRQGMTMKIDYMKRVASKDYQFYDFYSPSYRFAQREGSVPDSSVPWQGAGSLPHCAAVMYFDPITKVVESTVSDAHNLVPYPAEQLIPGRDFVLNAENPFL